ncbi:MAG: hypothetical protein HY738_12510 [Bacteroidia bacterium]|nr:hypothetical protein [Bacteroidia bacterium]
MKKIKIILFGMACLFCATVAFGQAVADNQVIPIGITLNPVLRITVIQGGNIQFVVNDIDEYKNGIASSNVGSSLLATDQYDSEFEVAASVDFNVSMSLESQFEGVDHAATLDNRIIGYQIGESGSYTTTSYMTLDPVAITSYRVLSTTAWNVVTSAGDYGNAGDADDNNFVIHWALATSSVISTATNGFGVSFITSELIRQNYAPDYYISNVWFELNPTVAW